MSCLGVHFSITAEEAEALRRCPSDADRLDLLHEEIEERYFESAPELLAESDKAWDAMHRLLSDGTLSWNGGQFPLNHAVLGGESLYAGDDYIIALKTPDQVREIAAALAKLDEVEFRRRYGQLDPRRYDGEIGEEDFAYTWEWFQGVRDLYVAAAAQGRHVLFTADQ